MIEYKPIAESSNFIVLDRYLKIAESGAGYQTENSLERELIQALTNQGYEHLPIFKRFHSYFFSEKNFVGYTIEIFCV